MIGQRMHPVPVVAWIFTALLLLLVVVCIMAGRGQLGMNRFVGIRFPSLMRSDSAWRAGHAAAVMPAVVSWGAALVCSAIGTTALPAYWGAIAAFVGGFVWVAVRASHAASKSDHR
ncbi:MULTISPECIES: SdpI family protein [Subtercola]|uniref:SdpI family protein n=1 Tax=Subtercola vilae TaxID=2056433 RepID=A0A4T2C4K7_9MICO|nr:MULTISPECIES: SdpI family protein [Subtercola]MEA9984201.1 SdpI family protein [Subtercola sp. RTI3]TIH37416.1 SdpI family protein [Subtercola vilae]